MENNNPNGGNINRNSVTTPTVPPQEPSAAMAGLDGTAPTVAPVAPAEAAVGQNGVPGQANIAPNPMTPGGLRPETMQSQKVTKDIKLPGGKKGHKGLIVGIIIVLILALGAGAAWWFMVGPGKTEEKTEVSGGDEGEKEEEAEEKPGGDEGDDEEITPEEEERRVREFVEKMRARAEQFLADKGINNDVQLTDIRERDSIYVRPDDFRAAVGSTNSIGFVAIDETGKLDNLFLESDDIAQALLEENGFQNYGFVGMGYALRYNPETGVYCAHEAGVGMFDVSCAYKTWVDESQKETVNQMAAGYLAGTGQEVGMISIDMANLEDSPVTPYQRIWVTIPSAAADFYRVSPESEWKFFRGGQDAAACEEYNTDELKNAYAGVRCYYPGGVSEGVVEAAN